MNWNARLALIIGPLANACVGLSEMPLAAFILLKTHNNFEVGIATGIAGVATLVVAPVSGCLADLFRRQTVLRIGAAATVINTAFMCTLLLYVQTRVSSLTLYELLLTNQFVYGFRRGITQPASEAIFGDSVESGRRSRIYAHRSALNKLGSACGPAVAAIIFASTGDTWSERELTWVLLAGNSLRLVPAALQCLYRDSKSLGAESEGLHVRASPSLARHGDDAARAEDPPPSTVRTHATGASGSDVGRGHGVADAVSSSTVVSAGTQASQSMTREELARRDASRCRLGPEHVAPLIALANLVAKIGSGLSVRYFSLYFWKELGMPPAFVMLVMTVAQLGGSFATLLAQRAALLFGRIQICLAFRLVGVGMLVAISLSPFQQPQYIVPLYLLRTWFVQSPIALQKSVLNDYVAKKHRAKWNALDSLNTSSWAGSAMLGGLLADRMGYRHVFLITAGMGVLASVLYLPLAWLVAIEGNEATHGASPAARHGGGRGRHGGAQALGLRAAPSGAVSSSAVTASSTMAAPLLSNTDR